MTRSAFRRRQGVVHLASCAAGCLAAVLIWGGRSSENAHLDTLDAQLSALPPAERRVLQKHFEDYRATVAEKPERKQQLAELHAAMEQDPSLLEKLQSFQDWATQLSMSELEQLRTDISQQRTDVILQKMVDDQRRTQIIVVDFPLFGSQRYSPQRNRLRSVNDQPRSAEFLPRLELTRSEYVELFDAAFPTAGLLPEQQKELNELQNTQEQSLLKTLFVLEQIRPPDNSPLEILRPFVEQLQSNLTDTDWSTQFSAVVQQIEAGPREPSAGRPEPRRLISRFHLTSAVMSIPDQAVIEFSRDLLAELEPDESALLRTLEAVDDPAARQELLVLPPDHALEQLVRIAIRDGDAATDPRRRLVQRSLEYEDRVRTFVRSFLPPGAPGSARGLR